MLNNKIGFVTYQATFNGNAASTRIRVTWPAKYMVNVYIGEDESVLSKCKAVVFQTRFSTDDVKLAKRLKDKNVKILCDFTDPHWSKDYGGSLPKDFKDIVGLSDCVMLPTIELEKSFLETFEDKQTVIIPDRIDLSIYDKVKKHIEHKDYRIVWHGSFGNICSMELARDSLEKLGKELKITLVCIYDHKDDHKINEFKNIKLECYEWTNQKVIDELLNCDLSINPRYDNWKSYKSDNKTVAAWACGIPCVERDFYKEIKRYFTGENAVYKDNIVGWITGAYLRNAAAKQFRRVVERQYDVKDTANQLTETILSLIKTGTAKVKKNITVYTAISGGFDGLREDQIIADSSNYVAFVDNPVSSYVWDTRQIYKKFIDPNLEAKIFKVLPWQFLNTQYSIWMDGTIAIKSDPQYLIDKFLNGYDIAIFPHHQRDDIYEEYIVDMQYRQREPACFRENQREKYIREGVPKKSGLWECGTIIRRHSDNVKRLCETWWAEITAFTSSDQCSFIYAARKHGIKVNAITPGTQYENPYTHYVPHPKTWAYSAEPPEVILETDSIGQTDKVKLKRVAFETFHCPYTGRMNNLDIAVVEGAVAKQLIADYPGAFVIIN